MGLPKGRTNNLNGRPPGSRNKRTEEIWAKLEKRGDLDPVEYLSSLVDNEKKPDEIRIAAAVALAPYRHSKKGLDPQPAPLVFVETPVELPHPHVTEVGHVVANIEYLTNLRASGRLDLDACDRLISDQRILGANLIEAAKLEVARGGPKDQTIQIVGGLPKLPGTDIDLSLKPLDALRPAVVNGEAVREGFIGPPVPFIPPEGSPLAEKPGPPQSSGRRARAATSRRSPHRI
jgi:hypothetical protein